MRKKPISSASQLLSITVFILAVLSLPACSGLPEPGTYDKPVSQVLTDTGDTRIARTIRENYPQDLLHSGFYPLNRGMDAFVARMLVVAEAERSLDLQYYMWHGDTSGALLANEVLKAARRGVRVRLLLDDLQVQGLDRFLGTLNTHPNIEVRLYNPFGYRGSRSIGFLGDLQRLNHRMHNKSLTADNAVTIVGGRNIGNEYFNATAHTTFADLDVIAIGPVVQDVSSMFDQYWNSEVAIPLSAVVAKDSLSSEGVAQSHRNFEEQIDHELASDYVQALRDSRVGEGLRFKRMEYYWGDAKLIYDDPGKIYYDQISAETHLVPKLRPMFHGARQEIQIVSPYFVPGDKLVAYLLRQVERGIRVRILTNSLAANDVGLVHAGYMRYRHALLEGGVELYEYKPGFVASQKSSDSGSRWSGSSSASLHAKTMGADGERIFVGSFNLDPRSVALNTEMGVIIENTGLGGMLERGFQSVVSAHAYQVKLVEGELRWVDLSSVDADASDVDILIYDSEPETSWWQRSVTRLLSLIVPEGML